MGIFAGSVAESWSTSRPYSSVETYTGKRTRGRTPTHSNQGATRTYDSVNVTCAMVRATSLIVGLAVASATATTASAFVPTGAPSVGRVDPLHAKGAKRAAAKRILLAPFRKLGIGSDGGSKATAPPAFEVWSPARKVDFGTSESWGKAEVDAYVAKVKAEVDVIAKARLDASAGLSKEEVDAYIAKVKAKVDVVAKARPAPAEMQAAGEVALVAAAEGRATAKKPVGEKQVFTGADVAPVESEGLSTEEVDEFLAESLLSAGLSKEQVDEFVTKVKFEVDMVAAKRTVPEEVVAANPAPVIKDAETPAPAAPTPAVAAPAAPSSDAAARSEAAQKINAQVRGVEDHRRHQRHRQHRQRRHHHHHNYHHHHYHYHHRHYHHHHHHYHLHHHRHRQYTAMEASTSVEASPSDAPDDVYVGDPEALLAAAEAAEAAGRYLDAAEGLVRFARIKTDGGCLRVKVTGVERAWWRGRVLWSGVRAGSPISVSRVTHSPIQTHATHRFNRTPLNPSVSPLPYTSPRRANPTRLSTVRFGTSTPLAPPSSPRRTAMAPLGHSLSSWRRRPWRRARRA